jgi:hypothetical protein
VVNTIDPDVYVFARRGFAGGQLAFMPGYYDSTEEQTRTLARLRGQSVPFALVSLDTVEEFRNAFPLIADHIRERYRVLTDVPGSGFPGVRVFIERDRPSHGIDPETGWPCFRP